MRYYRGWPCDAPECLIKSHEIEQKPRAGEHHGAVAGILRKAKRATGTFNSKQLMKIKLQRNISLNHRDEKARFRRTGPGFRIGESKRAKKLV